MGSGSAASSCRLRCTSRKSSTGKPRAPKCSGSSPLMSDTEMLPTSCPPLTMAAPLTLPWCMRAKACTAGMRASTHTTSLESRPSSWSVLPPVAPISSGWRCKNSTTSHCEMTCSKCPRALKHARRWHTGVVGTVRAPRKPLRTIHDIGAWRFFSRLMICPVLMHPTAMSCLAVKDGSSSSSAFMMENIGTLAAPALTLTSFSLSPRSWRKSWRMSMTSMKQRNWFRSPPSASGSPPTTTGAERMLFEART
mmetsp:Transcript_42235/g.135144  ORF Transcript_42235/g.135144 Transcript_42235/m.135144 type:complete len:251 (-) Transcript_42235:454-1206(-)